MNTASPSPAWDGSHAGPPGNRETAGLTDSSSLLQLQESTPFRVNFLRPAQGSAATS